MPFISNYILNLFSVAAGRQPSRPLLFSYYFTHRCNLNCAYCCDGTGSPFKQDAVAELTTDQAQRMISLLSRSADTLDVTGGEPMLRPDLEDVLAHAKQCGMRTVLNTKGIGLPERGDLMRYSDVLVISMDSLKAPALAKLFGSPLRAAEQVLEAIDFALAHRSRTKTALVLSVVATPANLSDADEVLEFACRNRIGFHVSPQIDGVHPHPALRNNAAYTQFIQKVLDRKAKGAGILGVPEYLKGIRDFGRFRCHPLLMPVIRPDGKIVYPCLERKDAQISVLDAGGYEQALRQARAKHGDIPDCGDCCHIFCHMALSLLQRRPLSALREGRYWKAIQE